MRAGTIHPNDCGNCIHWKQWNDEDWQNYCREMEKYGISRPEHKFEFGWCMKIPKGTLYDRDERCAYDGYSFADECYDEALHCFESIESDGGTANG